MCGVSDAGQHPHSSAAEKPSTESTPATVGMEGQVVKAPDQGPRRQYVQEDSGLVCTARLPAEQECSCCFPRQRQMPYKIYLYLPMPFHLEA